jgi:hypothetical protein
MTGLANFCVEAGPSPAKNVTRPGISNGLHGKAPLEAQNTATQGV